MLKEDLDFSTPSDLLFGQPVRLPGEFFEPVSEDAFNVNSSSFAQSLSRYMQQIPYFAPRRTNRAHYVDKAFMDPSTTHVFIKIDSHRPPLHAVYKGLFRIIQRHPKYFVVDLRTHIDNISVDRLKVAHLSLEGLNHNIKSQQLRLVDSSPSASELGAGNSNIIPTKPSLPTSTITCSSEDNMPTDNIHSSSLTSPQVITRKGRRVNRPTRFLGYDTRFNMLLFFFCWGKFPLFTRCFEGFRERALPSSFSKRLLVSFHSDFRQVFFVFFTALVNVHIVYIYSPLYF